MEGGSFSKLGPRHRCGAIVVLKVSSRFEDGGWLLFKMWLSRLPFASRAFVLKVCSSFKDSHGSSPGSGAPERFGSVRAQR
eukprot:3336836-Pyramimonas_sp.AAC.1